VPILRQTYATIAVLCASVLMSGSGHAVELRSGDIAIEVNSDGSGFLDRITLKERTLIRSNPGFAGALVKLTSAGDGTARSLFAHEVKTVMRAKVSGVSVGDRSLTVEGVYSDEGIRIPFARRLTISANATSVHVQELADFSRLDANYLVAEHSLVLPLVLGTDEHLRMLAFGGRHRAELFRMDMNDERRRGQSISSSRAFWPYWDIGGVVQLADSYHIFRANHANTMAYPIEEGRGAPGWADYSELDHGITVRIDEPQSRAPWTMTIDARKGEFTIAPYPGSQMPISGEQYGRRYFHFILDLHSLSWPTAHSCELDFERYKKLLVWLNQGGGFTHVDQICRALGVGAPEGDKTPEQLEDVCQRIIFKERIQPSVILRLLYRGDAWRMAGLANKVLGRHVPRNQTLDQWEQVAEEFLDKVRRDGLPSSG